MRINYHNRRFASCSNSANGEVGVGTVFHYQQEGELVWATYRGGDVVYGTLIARVESDDGLDMRYQHMNRDGELRTGVCRSTPELAPDGRLRLREVWKWTSGDQSSGESVLEELSDGN
jgi:hypothetical protein